MAKYLNGQGIVHLWSKISSEDRANTDLIVNAVSAIDEVKADKDELDKYLKKEDYIAGETGDANIIQTILETVYPIGAIYISTNDLDPSWAFGFGLWEKIQDRFLLAAGNNYPAGSTGGEAEHILTEEEMPAHDHEFDRHQLWRNEIVPPSTTTMGDGYGASNKTLQIYTDTTVATGAGDPHNNMPPYLAVHMWKRIE